MKTVMTILCWFFSPVVPYPDGSCYCIIKLFLVVAHCFKKTMRLHVIVHDIMYDITSMMNLECQLWFCLYSVFK
jgi:hypothetical protein